MKRSISKPILCPQKAIEFTGHTTRQFSLSTRVTRKQRVVETMETMGPSILLGVTLTNLPGIICLNWAEMQIIQIFFFRMCFVTTLIGFAHGIILLPVILSFFGKIIPFLDRTVSIILEVRFE
jgi:hypothetical protein